MLNRVEYKPFIIQSKSNNYVPHDIAIEQQKAFNLIQDTVQEPLLDWLNKQLHILPNENIQDFLSPEQIDAVAMAIFNLSGLNPNTKNKKDFIIADTMGNGKGRILASIVRYALIQHQKIAFFTISNNLFTAFWQDLQNVGATQFMHIPPFLYHGQAAIYEDGKKIQTSLNSSELKNIHKIMGNVLFTTYSQFNKDKELDRKIKQLSSFIDNNTIILFDEFHKSIGDSTTFHAKNQIIGLSDKIIRSSATFMSKNNHIDSYLDFFNLNYELDNLAIKTYQLTENYTINQQLLRNLTKKAQILRRENKEINNIQYISKKNPNLDIWLNQLRLCFLKLFETFNYLPSNSQSIWFEFGSTLVNLNKILILLSKKDFIIERIEQALAQNEKVIITLENTFESNIKKIQSIYKKLGIPNSFMFSDLLNVYVMEYYGNVIPLIKGKSNEKVNAIFDDIFSLINDFPKIPLSIIDEISQYFHKKGENILEISGRKSKVIDNKIQTFNAGNKAIIEYQFNNGWNNQYYNICFLTLSGSTGISLHASKDFKDQRKRRLIELQITDKEMEREQFFGRPNRKNQVNEPILESLSSDTLFEKRIIAKNQQKLTKMQSFTGNENIDNDLYNPLLNNTIYQYLLNNSDIAKILGINFNNDSNYYFLDTILKRSLLLDNHTQQKIENLINITQQYQDNTENVLKLDNPMFYSLEKWWQHPLIQENIILHGKEALDTQLPVLYYAVAKGTFKVKANIPELIVDKNLYNNHYPIIPIGTQITTYINNIQYSGYIYDIDYFNNSPYSSHCLYHIQLINPNLINKNKRDNRNIISINHQDLINNCIISHENIDLNKYIRHDEIVDYEYPVLLGNIFYLNLFHEVYKIGTPTLIQKDDNQIYALKLSKKETAPNLIIDINQGIKKLTPNGGIKSLDDSIRLFKVSVKDFKDNGYILALHDKIQCKKIQILGRYWVEDLIKVTPKRVSKELYSKEYSYYFIKDLFKVKGLLHQLLYNSDKMINKSTRYFEPY